MLVSGTDGVGTKLRLAMQLGIHDTIGIDLVAMCVNDLVVAGAEPLFFLDYYATGRLNVEVATQVIQGIGTGCEQAGCALVGGETAEMPGMYEGEDYDLAGFCVGVVEKSRIIDGSRVAARRRADRAGLERRALQRLLADPQDPRGERCRHSTPISTARPLGQALMAPTRIYVKPLLALIEQCPVHALAHITGGGLLENIPRVLPAGSCAVIDATSWQEPELFRWLARAGKVARMEMYRTFNCGVGMVICVPEARCDAAIAQLRAAGENAWRIGHIETAAEGSEQVRMLGG